MWNQKKPPFPISESLRAYLHQYERSGNLPIKYHDLLNWHDSAAIYDAKGNDTLWEAVRYHPSFQDEIESGRLTDILICHGACQR